MGSAGGIEALLSRGGQVTLEAPPSVAPMDLPDAPYVGTRGRRGRIFFPSMEAMRAWEEKRKEIVSSRAQEVLGQVHLNLAATLASGRDTLTSVHDRDGILLPPCAIFASQ